MIKTVFALIISICVLITLFTTYKMVTHEPEYYSVPVILKEKYVTQSRSGDVSYLHGILFYEYDNKLRDEIISLNIYSKQINERFYLKVERNIEIIENEHNLSAIFVIISFITFVCLIIFAFSLVG